jgi:hypothetical protein
MIWTYPFIFATGIVVGWGVSRLTSVSNRSSNPSSNRSSGSSIGNVSDAHSPDAYSPDAHSPDGSVHETDSSAIAPPLNRSPSPSASSSFNNGKFSDDAMRDKLEQLDLAYRMAQEMGQFKAGFLARTSHELRSPLNSIMSLQQLILTDLCDSPEEEREFVSQSYAASQKLLALLNETTNVSKLEEGTLTLHPEPLSLGEILSELESLTHLQAMNRNLRLTIQQPSPDITVMGDRRWLRQVLMSLVTSAIYGMDEGTIRVGARLDDESGTAMIDIEDERSPLAWSEPVDLLNQSPPGLTDDISTSTFVNPNDALTSVPSTGLSLVITQIMMEKMNGKLVLLSAPVSQSAGASSETETLASGTHIQCVLPLA